MSQNSDLHAQIAADKAALNLAAVSQVMLPDSTVPRAVADQLSRDQLISELMALQHQYDLTPDQAAAELLRSLTLLSAALLFEVSALAEMPVKKMVEIRRMELMYGGSGPTLE
ncbi:hypothetical protein [Streptomyces sp. CBMA123]|uniref:hypothetical protein n=1 Tax=Streptomyces sp. CBMA123 TaxID=1896313 RepID=UPI001661FE54|nr:hypothetical protein [Streptomyces sp. CBMA123]MBD0689686.1 hypothetical protein [Streptomyces sp. CBMA123]